MSRSVLSAAFVLALLLAPSAFAAWGVKGALEPDTRFDLDGLMHLEPDADPRLPTGTVYLNGFSGMGMVATTSVNPNAARLASSVHAPPSAPVALFGVWKDCNGDGYVGLGDQGLLEYPSTLLSRATVCPPVPGGSHDWRTHNDGAWVVELVPIGYDDVTTPHDANPLHINDTAARVWADWGSPGAGPQLGCATLPAPHGTFRSTGGLLRWLDCLAGHHATGSVNAAAAAAGHPELGFADAPADRPDESRSPLNRANPWGHEADASYARAVDCSRPTVVAVSDPTDPGDGSGMLHTLAEVPLGGSTLYVNATDGQGRVVSRRAYMVDPQHDLGGSPAGTVNETQAGVDDCDRRDTDEVVDVDGRRTGSDAHAPYALEGPNAGTSPFGLRMRTDFAFTFEEGSRGAGTAATIGGARARDDLGTGATSLTGFWLGNAAPLAGRDTYLSRRDAGPQEVSYITYYAYADPEIVAGLGLRIPHPLQPLFYGAGHCAPFGAFECDPALWWRGTQGEDVTPRDARLGLQPGHPTLPADSDATRIGVRVGQRYQMRDVDCVDASFSPAREFGVHWGALTQTACDRA